MRSPFHTRLGARLTSIRSMGRGDLHWLFLPGGPGLGSESLALLYDMLPLPGALWRLDLPGDGSNTTGSFSNYSAALVEAVAHFDKVILVAHSTGGMYALSTPALEPLLCGLILLDSAPDASWQLSFSQQVKERPIPHLNALEKMYRERPCNETLKELTVASAPYLFTEKGLEKGIAMLKTLPYSYETCQWSEIHFDPYYEAKWVPRSLLTLILSGEKDLITPLTLFDKAKRFHCKNISMRSIRDAGHFPWIENPQEVAAAFADFAAAISTD